MDYTARLASTQYGTLWITAFGAYQFSTLADRLAHHFKTFNIVSELLPETSERKDAWLKKIVETNTPVKGETAKRLPLITKVASCILLKEHIQSASDLRNISNPELYLALIENYPEFSDLYDKILDAKTDELDNSDDEGAQEVNPLYPCPSMAEIKAFPGLYLDHMLKTSEATRNTLQIFFQSEAANYSLKGALWKEIINTYESWDIINYAIPILSTFMSLSTRLLGASACLSMPLALLPTVGKRFFKEDRVPVTSIVLSLIGYSLALTVAPATLFYQTRSIVSLAALVAGTCLPVYAMKKIYDAYVYKLPAPPKNI